MTTTAPLDAGTDTATYLTMPVDADEGFPQSFLVAIGAGTYRLELYVDVPEAELPGWPADPQLPIDVGDDPGGSGARGLLVGSVIRQDPGGDTVLLRRRLLPGIVYTLQDLRLYVDEATVALGNLNAAGPFGSRLTIKVAPR